MSIILKGIDLPTDGESIRLVIASSGDVVEVWRDGLAKAYYPNKAVQIPKGHGDIKDVKPLRDEFSRTESGYCSGWEFCDKPEDFQFLIDDEPTILEAEE